VQAMTEYIFFAYDVSEAFATFVFLDDGMCTSETQLFTVCADELSYLLSRTLILETFRLA
jgi:hypothetical protein